MGYHWLGCGTVICFLLLSTFCPSESQIRHEPHCLWPTLSGPCQYCERGWYGDNCEYSCTNCDIGGCRKHNGICHQCSAGYYESDCNSTCPQHCRDSYDAKVYCDRETGKCLENCKHGWWGDWCKKKCSNSCMNNTCYFYDGSCDKGCKEGWFGEKCDDVKCPDTCGSTVNGQTCDQKTRRCLNGCEYGWWGDWCSNNCTGHCFNDTCHAINGSCIECQNGWTGGKCDVPCPQGCLHDACNRCNSAECTQGCNPGFYGDHCNQTCPKHCADQDCFFNHSLKSVTCRHGCMDGWWSHDCQKQCPNNCISCHYDSGHCPTAKSGFTKVPDSESELLLVIIVIPIVILLCIIAGLLIWLRKSDCQASKVRKWIMSQGFTVNAKENETNMLFCNSPTSPTPVDPCINQGRVQHDLC